jgi:signal transduction histidine kinase
VDVVLRNLINNAIKFTHENGKIEVSCKLEEDLIWVVVEDTGIGMTEQEINDLFKIGATKSQKGTHLEKGSGLGLLIVQEFLKHSNSKLLVESQKGKGSQFSFSLPRYKTSS